LNVRTPGSTDFAEVLALVRAADVAVIGETDWTEDSLRDEWRDVDLEHDAWVIELDGRIGAYATLENRGVSSATATCIPISASAGSARC
jgi:hypothetical protein